MSKPNLLPTLTELLIAQKNKLDKGITFISAANKEDYLSYQHLYNNALSLLGYLQHKGVKPGNEVVLQLQDNKTFLQYFWACILGGIIPVPVAVTFQGENAQKIHRIWQLLQHPYLVTSKDAFDKLNLKNTSDAASIADRTIYVEEADSSVGGGVIYPASAGDIAFLQFSSGSTGNPKGVVLKHSNLIANITSALPTHTCEDDRRLSWMPLTHDLGLIFFHLYPVAIGAQHFLMPTDLFIRHPLLWLQKVSEHKATITGSPNFGYKYYLNQFAPEKVDGLDLSSLQIIINGAEPIAGTLCRNFMQTLAGYGLRPSAMCPAYGLAESTLIVTFAPADSIVESRFIKREALTVGRYITEPGMTEQERTPENMEIVNAGKIIADTNVRITDEQGNTLSEGGVGIIWVAGPSVTTQYYNNETATNAVIKNGWLNTGDTGFMWNDSLYIVGRVKDIIIVNGLNVYPHDIEQTAEAIDGIETGKVLACGVPNEDESSESIVVFILFKLSLEKFVPVARHVKRLIAEQLGLEVKHVLPTRKIAKTTSGKVKRYLFSEEYRNGIYNETIRDIAAIEEQEWLTAQNTSTQHQPARPQQTTIRTWLENWLQQQLRITAAELSASRTFREYGITSIQAVALAQDLEQFLQQPVDNTVIYNYPNIRQLSLHLAGEEQPAIAAVQPATNGADQDKVAIIGIGCRLPGDVNNPADFWRLLVEKRHAITDIPEDRWNISGYFDSTPGASGKMYTRQGGFLSAVDQFDPLFFGISPKEAEAMDPQQRLLLEVCWEALEHAGIRPASLRGSDSGVFIGMGADDYGQLIRENQDVTWFEDAFTGLGTERSIAAGRIAYLLDFHGPAIQLDTACSSSLVAVHQACQSVLYDGCTLALAGGVNLMLSPDGTVKLCQMQALSPTGACKTFDDSADGYVRSEGAAVIVLKKLKDAIADGNNILAVISGAAVNHDGLSNGISAPNGIAQQQLINKALQRAGINAADVQYVETHGTGTRLGDPVEVQALNAVYGRTRNAGQPLLLGAVKSNIGHLEAAAGIAGLIKAVLCLQQKQIPASLHQHTPNRFIPWKEMPVQVVDHLTPWNTGNTIRRAAVSAFGLSGTNAHVILEEAPQVPAPHNITATPKPSYPLILSAKDNKALKALAQRYISRLRQEDILLPDLAASMAFTRDSHTHRLAIAADNIPALRQALQQFIDGQQSRDIIYAESDANDLKQAWLFTGQGSQYWEMGKELYAHNKVFKDIIDHCDAYLQTQWDISLLELLYQHDKTTGNARLRETRYTQPAIYAVGCALADTWRSWGITPTVVAGHSVGEFAAAYTAGVFSLDDGLRLITARAALMHAIEEQGSMAMAFGPEEIVSKIIQPFGNALAIAAVNGPNLIVISGKKTAVTEALAALKQTGIGSRELAVSHAFHSPLMEPMIPAFRQAAASIRFHTPQLPLVSNVTGDSIHTDITSIDYWCRHILAPVQFSKSIHAIRNRGIECFLELGPQPNLLSMAQLTAPFEEGAALPSMREGQSAWSTMLQALMALYAKGANVNWQSFFHDIPHRHIVLPTYPFQRQRYWINIKEKQCTLPAPAVKTTATTATVATAMPPSTPSIQPAVTPPADITVVPVRDIIINNLVDTLSRLLKIDPANINVQTPFLSQGADSLILASVVRKVEQEYGLNFSMRLLFEELTSVALMADYIVTHAEQLPQSESVTLTPVPTPTPSPAPQMPITPVMVAPAAINNGLQPIPPTDAFQLLQSHLNIIAQQFQLLTLQLQTVQQPAAPLPTPSPVAPPTQPVQQTTTPATVRLTAPKKQVVIFPKIETKHRDNDLTPRQQSYLDAFIHRYTTKTATSKALTRKHRPVLADFRTAAGFRFQTKDLVYPIMAASSQGSRITDVDGNEYIDLTMGFGVNLLGHRPEVINTAVQRQLEKGYQLGPQNPIAGEVAARIVALTGMDRVSFHNSGTEAVMSAMRIARAMTGKQKIAIFQGSYHGYFDGTLAFAEDMEVSNLGTPIAPGIIDNMIADILIFDYLNPNVTEQIRAHAHELAAVLVEPVQSRRPGHQPKALLQALRTMTREENILLIFDEMITGFRIHPGGAQAHFNVSADIVTYGKIVGGGFPIGIVAGRDWCMRAVDGGIWEYEDDSYPAAETTFLAGTFCKHPISMAAALAILTELEQRGPALQQELNIRTTRLVTRLSTLFEQYRLPVKIQHFSSQFYFTTTENMDLLFYHLVANGVYIWEGRSCFLSTAHSPGDIDAIEQAFVDSIAALQQGGFIPEGGPSPVTIPPRERIKEEQPVAKIGASPIPQQIPLSFNQERLWFIDQLEGSIQYNIPLALRLKGPVNKHILSYTLRKIISRHEILRTVILTDDGTPYQQLTDGSQWQLTITDEPHLRSNTSILEQYVSDRIYAPFDMSKDSMLRAELITLSPSEYILILAFHHIVFDDWSARVFFEELISTYNAYTNNTTADLPILEIQYKDYAVWQRRQQQGPGLALQLAHWQQQLANNTPLLLPTDFERKPIRSIKGALTQYTVEKSFSDRIHHLSRSQGVTLFTTLLSAFKVLMARYSGLEDISIACPVAGRTQPETEPLMGFFANTLILRTDLGSNPSFAQLLKQVSAAVINAHEYQDLPFNKLMDVVMPERQPGDNPFLHVMFTVERLPEETDLRLGTAAVTYEPVIRQTSIADITWAVEDRPDGVSIRVEYATDLFLEATIRRMMRQYITLLEAAAHNPALSIYQLPLINEKEQQQLTNTFNTTAHAYPADSSLVDRFEMQAMTRPDAVAVVAGSQILTYRSLDEKSNQVARCLQDNGVLPGHRIGLLAHRSPEMLTAIWGILKCGAAYVPFHTGYPAARIQHMIEDAGISKVLYTDAALLETIGLHTAHSLHITAAQSYSTAPLHMAIPSQAIANVMYTSGTTGHPKGIAVTHQNIAKLAFEPGPVAIQPTDRVLQWSNYSFDGATYDIYCSLLNGASLHLTTDTIAADAVQLAALIRQAGITVCFMTTALFNNFVDTDITALSPLRKILFGGEKVSVPHVQKALNTIGAGKMVHVYGPTETTVYATSYVINQVENAALTIPIGKPLANTQALILDAQQQVVPVGIDGELYIGGDGVTTGYVNNTSLTATRFVTLPQQTGRWYKTGDIARWLPDGNIIYTGRTDDQVKIRGYRIEPAEIERTISQLPDITACCVVVKQKAAGEKILSAYYVPASETKEGAAAQIRRLLETQLPDYMIPAELTPLHALPLTANGKVDRRSLSAQQITITPPVDEYRAPAPGIETQLAAIWQQLLELPDIGSNHNFFRLGGHSLLATRVVSAVRKQLSIELTVRDLFDHPTIAQLAAHLQRHQRSVQSEMTATERPALIPLSYSQERLWFIDQLEGSVQYHMPAAFQLTGTLNTATLANALRTIVNRHEVLRTVFLQEGTTVRQHILDEDKWQLQEVDGRNFPDNKTLQTYIDDLISIPFNLSADHMLRVHLIALGAEEHILVLCMHHIAADGWSLSVMVKELLALYNQDTCTLEPLPVQYADFAIWQRQQRSGERGDKQLAYWKQQLADVSVLQLPADFERLAATSTRGDLVSFQIGTALTSQLHALARQQDCTLYMLLLAAFKVLLYRYSGQEDITVGSGIAGRMQAETESLIGFFVNTLVMRSHLNGDLSFSDFLAQVRATTLDAYEHQEVPFEKIVEAVAGVRDTGRNPLFRVMFALQNIPAIPALQLGEVTLKGIPLPHTTSLFDLFWSISEHNDDTTIAIEYSTDLFTERTIRNMMVHYITLLQHIVQQPATRIVTLRLLNQAEQQEITQAFNNTAVDYPASASIVTLFEEQVHRTPDAIAIVFQDESLTYKKLHEQSASLARYLLEQGVQPGQLIPVCIERSLSLIIGILAIGKCGAAYVPIDPAYPAQRIRHILEDTSATLVLTSHANTGILRAAAPDITLLKADDPHTSQQATTNLPLPSYPAAADIAYVMYTSGSTGTPKGVLVTHRNVVSLVKAASFTALSAQEVLLSTGAVSFDATTFEYWGMLLNGGTLVMCPDKHLLDNHLLRREITRNNVTTMWITASWFNQLVDDDIQIFRGLSAILVGGEQLSTTHVQQCLSAHPDICLINGYGPTENTTFSTTWHIRAATPGKSIPIGRPLHNRKAYVLDPQQQLCPVGVSGELYVGGEGVAKGYLNQPDLTAEKFIQHPQLGRLYRTGDKTRWLPDGALEFLGRIDEQVKIRGYRIEPGEIETALQSLSEIANACVVVRQSTPGDKKLAAYYVPAAAALAAKEEQLYQHRVDHWQELYKTAFSKNENTTPADPEFDITGWNDSFTGTAIPAEQMQEWLQDITATILSLQPRKVLEIGCGTGLIYYQLASHIDRYIGADFSPVSTAQLQQHIDKKQRHYPETTLHVRPAHEVTLTDTDAVDLVILNSIIQYFPGHQYLTTVISNSISMLKGKGHIVIGDVRDQRLLPAFKRRLALQQLPAHTSVKDFVWQTDQDILKEEELCLAPAYFYQLQQSHPEIRHIAIHWKQADAHNELSLYRYTVVLYIGDTPHTWSPDWQQWQGADSITLTQAQLQAQEAVIAWKGVPNPRLWKERQLLHALRDKNTQQLRDLTTATSIQDEESLRISHLLQTITEQGYQYRFLVAGDPMETDLLIEKTPSPGAVQPACIPAVSGNVANNPLFADSSQILEQEIRQQLSDRLPEYMVPAYLTAVAYIPLTNNGKADRRFLGNWQDTRERQHSAYKAPATSLEIKLAAIWQRLLGVQQISIQDNFFALGGHSLLATRVVAAVRKELSLELTVKDFFVYPTIAQLADYLEGHKGNAALPAITIAERPPQIPLSFGQERLWFIDRLQGSIQYHMPSILRLNGELNLPALKAALQSIVNRHEILRTIIKVNDASGEGYQYILDKDAWQLQHITTPPPATDSETLDAYIASLIAHPFQLAADHMLRAHLLSWNDTTHMLILNIHHIASDGWSLGNLVHELTVLYHAYATGNDSPLKPLPLQYADYALWQRKYVSDELLRTQLAYWKQQLDGVEDLQLPTDFERPAIQSTKGAAASFMIDATLTAQLQALSRQQGTTLYMTLLAVFKILLYRYSGQEDIAVGSGVAGRTQEETEDMIGFFVNTLVMRSRLQAHHSFTDFLRQIKTTTLNAFMHQDVPFEKVVEAVGGQRDLSRNPLFQVVFLLQNTPPAPMTDLAGVTLSEARSTHQTSLFDISCFVTPKGAALQIDVEYCTDLFNAATIRRWMSCYRQLLQAVVDTPQQEISTLRMLNEAEQTQLLQFNKTRHYPGTQQQDTIVSRFLRQVEHTPDSDAVRFEEQILTYRQLDEQSGQVAQALLQAGITPDTLVPVLVNRSPELIVAIIGVLKAGAAFVPVDTSYPAERIAYILQDTAAQLILTDQHNKPSGDTPYRYITIGDTSTSTPAKPTYAVTAQQLAYLIYTSGSTGKPKGVMIAHAGVVNLALSMQHTLGLQPGMRTLQFASVSFDAACFEIFNTLLSGGTLVMADKDTLLSGDALETLLIQQQVTLAVLPPSYLQAMKDTLGTLQTIVSAGEPLSRSLADYIRNKGIRLFNAYGPTEGTICASLTDQPVTADGTVVIGTPVTNVPLYVLDAAHNLVPLGGVGELCMGGIQVAQGYLNRPDLTAEKFINDPFGHQHGRLYKTGDLVRWREDGNLVYLGRKDEQVKIRGHRIELGEIEHAVSNIKQIATCCVVHKQQDTHSRLVCYFVAEQDLATPVAALEDTLRNHLLTQLPEYMVPADFIAMSSLPVTSSGKIDRKQLQQLEDNTRRSSGHYQAPSTVIERHLAAIWQELLGIPRVGIDDNFFEMGGDSIITIQVVNRAKHYGYLLQPRQLFTHQTIASLAALLEAQEYHQVQGEQGLLTGPAGLLPVQQWYLEDDSNVSDHFIQNVPLEINKEISPETLQAAITALVAYHDSLRFAYHRVEGYWQQSYGSDTGRVVVVDLRDTPAQDLPQTIAVQEHACKHSLHMQDGQLVCAVLFLMPADIASNRLLLIIHHLGIDVVSWRIILDDLDRALQALQSRQVIAFPPKGSSCREWYNALEEYGQSARLLSQRPYWYQAMQQYIPVHRDKQYEGLVKISDMTAHRVRLDATLTRQLLQEVASAYQTDAKDILLTALALTLSEWMQTTKVTIGFEKHGREDISTAIDVSHTTGWFTTLSPVLLDTSTTADKGALISNIKTRLQQVPDKGIGFGVLKYINKDQQLQGKDPWDVIFNFHGQTDNVSSTHQWITLTDNTSELNLIGDYTMRFLLFVDSAVADNELLVDWLYSTHHYHAATIESLGETYIRHLRELIAHCMKRISERQQLFLA